jgi:hypothetical protein
MSNKVVSSFIAAALCTTLALASPAFARGGGGGGGHGGGGHGGGMGGGIHGGMGGGMHFGAMSGAHFASAPFAHAGVAQRFSRFGFRDRHHRFHRFAFVGAPYGYAAYDNCWRRVWTSYGLRWVDVCGDYGY